MMKWDHLCPICGKEEMESTGYCNACGADLGGVNIELVRSARRRLEEHEEIVWENECHLVLSKNSKMGADPTRSSGTMGLDYPDGTYIRVNINSYDPSKKHEIFSRLEKVPVRVTIRRVPGGNA